ncbi:MAG: glycosyltransferase family 2 protein, partial [Caldilinea sp.]|nr:glycosyltransferase family 2 protein [Caldilinea sp.]MCB0148419.1 glycosyltransferase family 2 protein [Caldilineaceae bacterium]
MEGTPVPNLQCQGGTEDVSVVIAVRNGERFLAEALRSVARQTVPPCEVLVIDGHSTDDTARIA